MKICIIGDTHAGVRADSSVFLNAQEKFYSDLFFPTLEKNNITQIIHLGDYFDRRKYINFGTLQRNKKMFIEPFLAGGYKMDIILGNHDVASKNTNEVNSINLLLGDIPGISVIEHPTERKYGKLNIGLVPWMCPENEAECLEYISQSMVDVLMGHFEIKGFEVFTGQINIDHGLNSEIFSGQKRVFSGHFHHRSNVGNIHYLGSPYEMIWSDCGDPRGFHLLDCDTGHLEFIQNPHTMFEKIFYDDREKEYKTYIEQDFSQYRDKYVKVLVTKKEFPYWFDNFVENLYKAGPADVNIVDEILIGELDEALESAQTKDSLVLIREYVDSFPDNVNKEEINTFLRSLYLEALESNIQD